MFNQQEKVSALVERRAKARLGGGAERIDAQHAKGKLTASLLIPEGLFMMAIPIGCILLMLHSVEFMLDILTEQAPCMKEEKKEAPEE